MGSEGEWWGVLWEVVGSGGEGGVRSGNGWVMVGSAVMLHDSDELQASMSTRVSGITR